MRVNVSNNRVLTNRRIRRLFTCRITTPELKLFNMEENNAKSYQR